MPARCWQYVGRSGSPWHASPFGLVYGADGRRAEPSVDARAGDRVRELTSRQEPQRSSVVTVSTGACCPSRPLSRREGDRGRTSALQSCSTVDWGRTLAGAVRDSTPSSRLAQRGRERGMPAPPGRSWHRPGSPANDGAAGELRHGVPLLAVREGSTQSEVADADRPRAAARAVRLPTPLRTDLAGGPCDRGPRPIDHVAVVPKTDGLCSQPKIAPPTSPTKAPRPRRWTIWGQP